MIVYDHALDNYLMRVLNIEYGQAGGNVVEYAKEQIKEAVNNPDNIFNKEKGSPPVHIRNGAAVVVKEEDGEKVIPTVYNEQTFLNKMDSSRDINEIIAR